jgi:hypothetical protein
VYALRQGHEEYTSPKHQHSQSPLADPAVIRAAGEIYYTLCEAHPEVTGQPTGVAINRITYRGKVIFTNHPVLLPQECFVPLSQIESHMY